MNTTSTLPAGLADVLNRPDEHRDSAYYSNMDPSSKHTSTQSSNGHHVLTPPHSGYQSSITEHTPSPIATGQNQPLPSPASGSMSVASMVSPTTDQSMLRKLDNRHSYAHDSINSDANSRRESVNSQLALGDLRLANSPYASANQSTTSIQSTLQQQRNPGGHIPVLTRYSSGPIQRDFNQCIKPKRDPKEGPVQAPVIAGPSDGAIARAPEPTQGHGWAFPEEEVRQMPSAARPSGESQSRQGTSFLDSRRSSLASVASSQYTTESRLPTGQRRLDEGIPNDYEYNRQSRTSSEFQQTHHHHLQPTQKQVADLTASEAGSPSSNQPYSRTPELRVSHKLAERKRRTEMKELFDQLRDMMPQERGSKASKWEILTKAIAEYGRLTETISREQSRANKANAELEHFRRENQILRLENAQFRANYPSANGVTMTVNIPPDQMQRGGPPLTNGYPSDFERSRAEQHSIHSRPDQGSSYLSRPTTAQQLPPLRMTDGPDSMNGVQYHNPSSGANGYDHRF